MEVLLLPSNKRIEVEKGIRLISLLIDQGIVFSNCCMGAGSCGKCVIQITKGNISPLSSIEKEMFTESELKMGKRLACHVNVIDNMVVIHESTLISNRTVPSMQEMKNLINDRINISVKQDRVISQSNFGAVIDIGTTNLVVRLMDIDRKEILCEGSMENPQRKYGLDVISRITYGIRGTLQEEELYRSIREGIEILLKNICNTMGISYQNLKKCIYLGNTTMIYTFLRRPLLDISKGVINNINYSSVWNGDNVQMVLPLIRGHVGSDVLAGIISLGLHKKVGNYLLIDIGTNGEIVLSKDGELTVCSTAAGPAFEGGNITCGMVASKGAITSLYSLSEVIEEGMNSKIVRKRESNSFNTIGLYDIVIDYIGKETDTLPIGICGSGFVDGISLLLKNKWMDKTGRLLGEFGEKNRVTLYKDNTREIYITQKDIREFQLAKGAIYAGIKVLLTKMDMNMEELDGVYIAGALGNNMNRDNMIITGLIPKISLSKIHAIGNSALDGGEKVLLDLYSLEEIEKIAVNCKHIELANVTKFQEIYMSALNFEYESW